jgi:hypothetical protein
LSRDWRLRRPEAAGISSAVTRLAAILLWVVIAGVARADGEATIMQKFEGTDPSATTATFTVPDKWELVYFIGPPSSLTILTADGQVVAGWHGTFGGSIYLPKGGTYYIQITRDHPEMRTGWKFSRAASFPGRQRVNGRLAHQHSRFQWAAAVVEKRIGPDSDSDASADANQPHARRRGQSHTDRAGETHRRPGARGRLDQGRQGRGHRLPHQNAHRPSGHHQHPRDRR